jgi:hypothetical protein
MSDSNARFPRVVWNGTEYGVVWQDARSGHYEVYFARVGPDGERAGPEVPLTAGAHDAVRPNILWTGSTYVVAWYGRRADTYEIEIATVDVSGAVVIGPVQVTTDASFSPVGTLQEAPRLAMGGERIGVAWVQGASARLATFDRDLATTGGVSISDAAYTGLRHVGLTFAGGAFLAATAIRAGAVYEIRSTRHGPDAMALEASRLIVSGEGVGYYAELPAEPGPLAVVWDDFRSGTTDVWFRTLDDDGGPTGVEHDLHPPATRAEVPEIVWAGDRFAVAYQDIDGGGVIFVERATDGRGLSSRRVERGYRPDVAWSGSRYGVAYFLGSPEEVCFAVMEPDDGG